MTGNLLRAPASDEIHVWTVALNGVDEGLLAESGTLSPDELDRARRYRLERDRRRFVVSRAALRHLLGSYLGVDPGSVPLVPALMASLDSPYTLRADCVSTLRARRIWPSSPWGTIARSASTSSACVEEVDLEPLARRVLGVAERLAFGRLKPEPRRRAFYRSWTRKEACLKALGVGLTVAPDRVDVTDDQVKLPTEDPPACRCSGPNGRCTMQTSVPATSPPSPWKAIVGSPDGARTHRSVRRSGPGRLHFVTGRATQSTGTTGAL